MRRMLSSSFWGRAPARDALSTKTASILTSSNTPTVTARPLATHTSNSSTPIPSPDKPRVVILGSGWGGYNLSRKLSPAHFTPTIISPRSYFVFTPLLTDTAGGSLDFSHIVEPVRDRHTKVDFIQAAARAVDFASKTVICEATVVKSGVTESPRTDDGESQPPQASPTRTWEKGETFSVPYDKLVIAVGTVSRTFGTPGVRENAFFFKDVGDARRVRRRVRECFELAVLPTTSPEMRRWLLHFAIVGAGPTGTELAAALRDFISADLMALYPSLKGIPRLSLYDVAPTVLSMFDESLSKYAMDTMRKEGVDIKVSHHVEGLRWGAPGEEAPAEMDPKRCLTLTTKEEGEVGVGMCVWATGNAMNPFVRDALADVQAFPNESALLKDGSGRPSEDVVQRSAWHVKKAPKVGALLVDEQLRVQLENESGDTVVLQDVFALGDNAMPEKGAPPATAQATFQEAKWLANRLNRGDSQPTAPFSFRNMGTLAYIGNANALLQIPHENGEHHKYLPEGLKGRTAWLVWNSAYLTMSISWRNKVRVAVRWMLNHLFGRDVSRY
ncbi:putative pyridine nucleotide-disulfide oxidoreductase [Aspergillus aculeatinus CBS 121060]|uniref:Nucleotide-binding domain-containing protein n=1 Tax=Aspergillus aculeatinus CBS 121060 TaxID=1448322 RepID=A0ACD1H552_9EURO|nr:nucleotide-binding domain-containing protein [Aspergillus aculeatinus CBS 121060]RAH68650.1 nucleotide-binding domain-containing protein [Aspergillus aculeatinus CBS 121060]